MVQILDVEPVDIPIEYTAVTINANTGCTVTENNTTIFGNLAVVELVVHANTALAANSIIATFADYISDSGKILSVSGVTGYCYTVTNSNGIYVNKAVSSGTDLIIWGVVTLK